MAKQLVRSELLNMRVSKTEKQRARVLAEAKSISVATLVRQLLQKAWKQHEAHP